MGKDSQISGWEPREIERQLIAIPRYLRHVKLSKIFIGLAVIFLLAVVLIIPQMKGGDAMRIALPTTKASASKDATQMQSPHFESVDSKNQPFSVTAKTARQVDATHVKLEQIDGKINLAGGDSLTLKAQDGLYNLTTSELTLNGQVAIASSKGYLFETPALTAQLTDGKAAGEQPVTVTGPTSSLKADRFHFTDQGDHLFFDGNVSLTITR